MNYLCNPALTINALSCKVHQPHRTGVCMKVADALSQIAEIHDQLTKAEVYRGFRPAPVALSGLVGVAAATVQPWLLVTTDYTTFVRYWLVVGLLAGVVGGSATAFN